MHPNEYQQLAMRTICDQEKALRRLLYLSNTSQCDYIGKTKMIQLNHATLGLAGDAGELCNAVARCIYYGKELDLTNVKEEIGDCLWWLAEACDAIGVNMEDMMEANIRKLEARYPDKYTDQHAAEENRNREAERKAIEHSKFVGEMNDKEWNKIGPKPITGKDVDEITRLPKPEGQAHYCPKCGAFIGKRMVKLVTKRRLENDLLTERNKQPAYPCPDCNQPLTDLRLAPR